MTKHLLPDWIPEIYHYSTIFQDLKWILEKNKLYQWPDCQQLMGFLEKKLCSYSGKSISMLKQDEFLPYPQMSYEERIYKTGIISTREKNWHDFFNAMIWVLFPQTKNLLNDLHIKAIKNQLSSVRNKARDAITHLDESGIIVVSSSAGLLADLKQHLWLEVFYQHREDWLETSPSKKISAFVFGHGIYEKALNPFIGFTAKMYSLSVKPSFFKLNKKQQYQQLDQLLATDIMQTQALKNNKKLSPLPVLGIPEWTEDNKQKKFYFDKNYFRAKNN